MTRPAVVAVVGPGDTTDSDLLGAAERIGRGLAAARVTVVTGGLGGVMAAASRGAASAGGLVVGVLPGTDADAANEWVSIAVPTGLGQARNTLVVRCASVVVAVGGSWGTLSEIAFAKRLDKPVVGYRGWRVEGPADDDGVVVAATPDDAVSSAVSLLGGPPA